jgi:flagellar hook-length control protein FliK
VDTTVPTKPTGELAEHPAPAVDVETPRLKGALRDVAPSFLAHEQGRPLTRGTTHTAVPFDLAVDPEPVHAGVEALAAALADEAPTARSNDRQSADTPAPIVSGAPTTSPASPVAAPTPTPDSPPAPPAPHAQLASMVGDLRHEPDGTYRLTLHLHPGDLGPVHVEVELRGAEIALRVVTQNESARQALQGSVSELRSELEAGGLTATSVDISGHESQPHLDRRPDHFPPHSNGRPDASLHDEQPASHPIAISPTRRENALDVRI